MGIQLCIFIIQCIESGAQHATIALIGIQIQESWSTLYYFSCPSKTDESSLAAANARTHIVLNRNKYKISRAKILWFDFYSMCANN